jgi:heme/copper-type cytochrome/quinol oxidase subunit 1
MIRLMRRIDGLTKGQRVVLVIAFGIALETLGGYVLSLGSGLAVGWYAYSPLSGSGFPPSTGLHGWLRLIIWLVLIGVWALGSIRVLRPSAGDAPSREPASRSGD